MSRDFRIVVKDAFVSLWISSLAPPELSLIGVDDDQRWAVYSKVKAVFDARAYKFKGAILSLPPWTLYVLFFVWFGFSLLTGRLQSRASQWAGIALNILVSGLFSLEMTRRNIVVFRRFHASKTGFSERLRTSIQNVLFTLLGAVLSVVLQAVYDHYRR